MKTIQIIKDYSDLKKGFICNTSDLAAKELIELKYAIELMDDEKQPVYSVQLLRLEELQNKVKRVVSLPELQLPQDCLNSWFAQNLSNYFKNEDKLFFRPRENEIIEVTKFIDKTRNKEVIGFHRVDNSRLINIVETKVKTFRLEKNPEPLPGQSDFKQVWKSMSDSQVKAVRTNDAFIQSLSQVDRLFFSPMFFIYENKLVTQKIGYDERFMSYTVQDCPPIGLIDLQKAKEIIDEIFTEFCFEDKVDEQGYNVYKTIALAAFFSPFLRGLYPRPTCRSPIFFYMANRERAGKDYLAGITGLVLEGSKAEESPISTDEKGLSGGSEEIRKKVTGALLNGTRRMHFANNRGHLNIAAFEAILTAEQINDRKLGGNENVSRDNEIEFSLSGNVGIYWTADFWNRCRPIKLFLDIEDPNTRLFIKTDLHGWVLENRALILSSIYTLIHDWVINGKKLSKSPFSSFPDWAAYCGGFMQHHNYGNPCQPISDDAGLGGDTEGLNAKGMFELCYNNYCLLSPLEQASGISKAKIIEWLVNARGSQDNAPFNYLDLENDRGDQTKFGNILIKYKGRLLSNICLKVLSDNKELRRVSWTFVKKEPKTKEKQESCRDDSDLSANLANLDNLSPQPSFSSEVTTHIDSMVKQVGEVGRLAINEIVENPTELQKLSGEVFESQPNVWRKVV